VKQSGSGGGGRHLMARAAAGGFAALLVHAREELDHAQRERPRALQQAAVLRKLEGEAREALGARGHRPDPDRHGGGMIDVVVC
jgi:hypothetical protein